MGKSEAKEGKEERERAIRRKGDRQIMLDIR
jgi:hypothetical protein